MASEGAVGVSGCRRPDPVGRLGYECITGRGGRAVSDGRGRFGLLPGGAVITRPRWLVRFKGPGVGCGGTRGAVSGLSGASRRRLCLLLASVDWAGVPASFCSLTYHRTWGDDWQDWKRDLQRLRKRLFRLFAGRLRGVIWRFEFQRRGAPHFHLLLFWRGEVHNTLVLSVVRRAWLDVIGEGRNVAAIRHGVRVDPVDTSRGVRRLQLYLSKYVAKKGGALMEETGELVETGRVWGHWGDVPSVTPVVLSVSVDDYEQLIRRIRALFGGRSRYIESLTSNWAGALVIGDPSELYDLTEGLDCEVDSGG